MENTLTKGTVLQGKAYRYVIERVLGQGTFGITYLATTQVKVAGALGELETTMQVAVKEFFMKDINGREENTVTTGSKGGLYANYKAKFAREAENLSRLTRARSALLRRKNFGKNLRRPESRAKRPLSLQVLRLISA